METCYRTGDLREEIIETTPVTYEGLVAKLRLLAEEVRSAYPDGRQPVDIYERALLALGGDAERLTGGGTVI
jgi:hypothetical protein